MMKQHKTITRLYFDLVCSYLYFPETTMCIATSSLTDDVTNYTRFAWMKCVYIHRFVGFVTCEVIP